MLAAPGWYVSIWNINTLCYLLRSAALQLVFSCWSRFHTFSPLGNFCLQKWSWVWLSRYLRHAGGNFKTTSMSSALILGAEEEHIVCWEERRWRVKGKRRAREVEELWEAAGFQQVCKDEIRILQVSLQDWYIDLREGERTMSCGQVHYWEPGFEYYFICCSVIVL